MTFALAKTFTRVEAYELCPVRFELLQGNVRAQGAGNVVCVCGDSMASLLGAGGSGGGGCSGGGSDSGSGGGGGGDREALLLPASVVDPPWGGLCYDPNDNITFAGLPLHVVVGKLMGKVGVLGIKLPLKYDVRRLTRLVEEETSGKARVRAMNKVFRQFFVVFSLFPVRIGSTGVFGSGVGSGVGSGSEVCS